MEEDQGLFGQSEMIIDFHKNFQKQYRKLSRKVQFKVDESIKIFRENPFHVRLQNHALTGKMQGKRAFWVTGNVRVIFEEYNHYTLVLFLDVGGHSHVYN